MTEQEQLLEIEDVLSLGVTRTEANKDLDTAINSFSLDSIQANGLSLTVDFSSPRHITKNVIEPDLLEVVVKLPDLFIDKQTGETLAPRLASTSLNLVS